MIQVCLISIYESLWLSWGDLKGWLFNAENVLLFQLEREGYNQARWSRYVIDLYKLWNYTAWEKGIDTKCNYEGF